MKTKSTLYCVVTMLGALLGATDASAKICETCDPPPSPIGGSPQPYICGAIRTATVDDLAVIGPAGWGCTQESINAFWGGYHYEKDTWTDWGYNQACDPAYPLAQEFNANFLVHVVPWFTSYPPNQIDELDGDECGLNMRARTDYGIGIDNLTAIYLGGLYTNWDPISRASTLVHEARHAAAWIGHSAPDDKCSRGASCDDHYRDDYPNSYQVDFLRAFAGDCAQPYKLRVEAVATANSIAATAFRYPELSPTTAPPDSNCPNYAFNHAAFQIPDDTTQWYRTPPSRAVDGNTDGNYWDGSVSHTAPVSTDSAWWVDLGSIRHIRRIMIFNRTDYCPNCLSGYNLRYSADSTDGWNGGWPYVATNQLIPAGDPQLHYHDVDILARWVLIELPPQSVLHLAEVQVLGW